MHDVSSAVVGPLIVGLSVRVPGARGNRQMWDVLANGLCTVSTVDSRLFDPARYFDPQRTRRGKTYTIAAGQLENIYHFDAAFFGISPREADQMDPQQTLMLQSVWEAVADAGLDIGDLAGERTGVFVGSSLVEGLTLTYYDPARGDSTFILGNTLSIVANRVSSVFDFRGPSLVVDTACASSFYALDLAVAALNRDEIDTAIVGGVHMARTPGGYVTFSQARMLSPTGLCRAFGAEADGYVRSEASVAVVLQRPGVAARMGARRRARILASAVNTDGGTSRITIPSARQQGVLMDRVLAASGVDPDDFAFVEAHGTGTPVGDPIEAASIGASIAKLRREPLLIGSSKTNFGHSEPASGLVALAKTLLAMEKRALPASLHCAVPNPSIDFEGLNLSVNGTLRPLAPAGPLIAGINSFGFGGTNANVIVSSDVEPQRMVHAPRHDGGWLLISAASQASLRELAKRWAGRLDRVDAAQRTDLVAAAGRQPFLTHRIALPVGPSLVADLRRVAAGEADDVLSGRASLHKPRTVFAFAGNGTQVVGMGRAEYKASPRFRRYFDEIAQMFARNTDVDLVACLHDDDLGVKLLDPVIAQSILFAYQVALARSLHDGGLTPDAVLGHSVGEIAALHIAGVFDLADAVHIIISRSRAFIRLRGSGTMAAVAAPVEDVERAIRGLDAPDLVIAAINSPRSVTVSGPADAIARLRRVHVSGRRLPIVPLKVEIPYHSPAVDGLHDRFMADLAQVTFNPPQIPVASSVLGRILRPRECDAGYMWRNARDVVRFSDALGALCSMGATFLAEMSPTASLAGNVRDLARQDGVAIEHFSPASHPDFSCTVARAWAAGAAVSVTELSGTPPQIPPVLPRYPWDERDHFSALTPDGLDAWGEQSARGFVGLRAERSVPVWLRDITPTSPAWVTDHKVGKAVLLPATALVEMAVGAGCELFPDAVITLSNFDIITPVVVTGDGVRLRTVVDSVTGAITIAQRPRLTDAPWETVARGVLRTATATAPTARRVAPNTTPTPSDALYEFLGRCGLVYGAAFRRAVQTRMVGRDGVWVDLAPSAAPAAFALDPMAFDAALHGLGMLLQARMGLAGDRVLVPVRMGRLTLWQRSSPQVASAMLRLVRVRTHSIAVDIVLFDPAGAEVARIDGVDFAGISTDNAPAIPATGTRMRYVSLRPYGHPLKPPAGWSLPSKIAAKSGFADGRPAPTDLERALDLVRDDLANGRVPDFSDVTNIQPQIANDLRAMMCAATGRSPHQDRQQGLAHRLVWRHAERILTAMSRGWRKGQRFNLLINGIPSPDVVRRIRALAAPPDRIFMTLSDGRTAQHLTHLLPPDLRPLLVDTVPDDGVDVILDVDDVPSDIGVLAGGGIYLRLDVPAVLVPQVSPVGDGYWLGDELAVRLGMLRKAVLPPVSAPQVTVTIADGSDALPADGADLIPLVRDDGAQRIIISVPLAAEDPSHAIVRILDRIKCAETGLIALFVAENDHGHAVIAAGLAAAMRTIANEMPQWPCGLIVVGAKPDVDWGQLIRMARENGTVYVTSTGLRAQSFDAVPPANAGGPQRLAQTVAGRFDTLGWVPANRRTLKAGEVEITVAATGVNFRDVMSARGILPERMLDAGATQAALGMECAGVVTRVGVGCSLVVGTRVMALAPAAFANVVCLPEDAVTPIPETLTMQEAAAIPVAYLTAWHALVNVARLRALDTVLIHGAAGGVGLAAIHVARLIGARVLATAGSDDKRALVRGFGADAVFDSRSLQFADDVRAATKGRGVDVVLNSLSGAAMQRSVECLAPFGAFVELGKRDYLEGTALDLRPFLNNLSYHGVDLDQYVAHNPARVRHDMARIAEALRDGQLRPLPVVTFDAADASQAFAHMFAARHVGKIALAPPPMTRHTRAAPLDGDWVLVGGTGGLGLGVARMLLGQGACRVHLVSRSGQIGLENIREYGWMNDDVRVVFHAVDAADRDALATVFDRIESDGGEIAGVMHMAMVLRDRMLLDLDLHEAAQVMHAKLGIAQAMDDVLRGRKKQPRHVVFFSSVAAMLGNVGQVAYGAANAAVEELAALRRSDGLPALCIGWGPIADAGYLLRDASVAAQISRQRGIKMLKIHQVTDHLLSALLNSGAVSHTYAAANLNDLSAHLPALGKPAFASLVEDGLVPHIDEGELTQMLRALPWSEAQTLARAEVARMLTTIMHMPVEQFDMNRPLTSHGLDSLMAMEMRLEIEQRFGCAMPAAGLARDVTGARLAALLLGAVRDTADVSEDK